MSADPNVDKYLEVIQFLLDERTGANNCHLGKVKLMKLLYFADFDHYFRHGVSITGDTYVKLEYGPVPKHGQTMLNELERRGLMRGEKEPVFAYAKNSYRLQRSPGPINHLNPNEVSTLADVVGKWGCHTREEIVTASHGDPPWIMVDAGEDIPYELVFYRENVAGSKDERS